MAPRCSSGQGSNNSFKPNLLRYTNNMAGRACHVVASATQVGLTQALGGAAQTVRRLASSDSCVVRASSHGLIGRQLRLLSSGKLVRALRSLAWLLGVMIAGPS